MSAYINWRFCTVNIYFWFDFKTQQIIGYIFNGIFGIKNSHSSHYNGDYDGNDLYKNNEDDDGHNKNYGDNQDNGDNNNDENYNFVDDKNDYDYDVK